MLEFCLGSSLHAGSPKAYWAITCWIWWSEIGNFSFLEWRNNSTCNSYNYITDRVFAHCLCILFLKRKNYVFKSIMYLHKKVCSCTRHFVLLSVLWFSFFFFIIVDSGSKNILKNCLWFLTFFPVLDNWLGFQKQIKNNNSQIFFKRIWSQDILKKDQGFYC